MSGHKKTLAERLAPLAHELGAERVPYYVPVPPPGLLDSFPAAGWYWVPPEHAAAVYLAYTYDAARDTLTELLRRAAALAAAA